MVANLFEKKFKKLLARDQTAGMLALGCVLRLDSRRDKRDTERKEKTMQGMLRVRGYLRAIFMFTAVAAMSAMAHAQFGGLAAPVTYFEGRDVHSVAFADLNGNGVLDSISASYHNTPTYVRFGNGDGTFGAGVPLPYSMGFTASIAVGDLNGDGIPDLVASRWLNFASVLLGNGDGTFGAPTDYQTGTIQNNSYIAMADLNADGHLDLIVPNGPDHTVSVLLGNGDGTFLPRQSYAVDTTPLDVAIDDLNSNGVLDLAVANNDGGTVSILLGNGDGTFQSQQAIGVGLNPQSVATGDLDGDGVIDLVTVGSNALTVLLGNSDGTFQVHPSISMPFSPIYVAMGDLNGNGTLDLALSKFSIPSVDVLLGNGDGTFGPVQGYSVSHAPRQIQLADLNNNGVLDIGAAAPHAAGRKFILINLTEPPVTTPCLADLNGDDFVNVFDLLDLLAAWGPCSAPCPADLDDNGIVNVFDLLELLAEWGPCS